MKRSTQTISPAFWIDFWMVMTIDCGLVLEVIQTLLVAPNTFYIIDKLESVFYTIYV